MFRYLFMGLILATAATLFCGGAKAQHVRYVAVNGNDANNVCATLTAPCRTLQRAFQFTPTGGEIRVLSFGNYGTVPLDRSVTIAGDDLPLIGGFVINSASAIVILRGLQLNGGGALATGINILNAAAVHVENCTVERFTGDGVHLAAGVSTELLISDSVIRDNGSQGLDAAGPTTAKVSLYNSRFENNAGHGTCTQPSVSRSVASGNFAAFTLEGGTIEHR